MQGQELTFGLGASWKTAPVLHLLGLFWWPKKTTTTRIRPNFILFCGLDVYQPRPLQTAKLHIPSPQLGLECPRATLLCAG